MPSHFANKNNPRAVEQWQPLDDFRHSTNGLAIARTSRIGGAKERARERRQSTSDETARRVASDGDVELPIFASLLGPVWANNGGYAADSTAAMNTGFNAAGM